ncbi:MAG: L,D-transpeptidase family protein [Pseudomonadota bacterium]
MKTFSNLYSIFLLLLISLVNLNILADEQQNKIHTDQAELELIQIIDLIQAQKIDTALSKSNKSLQKYPNFKLLNAVHADLLYSQHNKLIEPFRIAKNQQNKEKLLFEASVRLDSVNASTQLHQEHLPDLVKYIDDSTAYFFVIDFSKSRLYLFENSPDNLPILIADHYVTIGANGYKKQIKGDSKTPLGIYHVTSFLDDNQLPELYGWGAFPINYPNAWDKKNQRTGSGIWLHGVPRNTYSRPPLDSKGCLVISNDFLINIASYLKINTPVILTQSINWIPKKHFKQKDNAYKKALNEWKNAWQSKNIKRYLGFYSKSFNNNKKNYSSWAKHKRRIFAKTKRIDIKIKQLSVFSYPGESDMLAVSFYQSYKGDRYRSGGYKQQYWKKEADGQWRIIYEFTGG